MAQIRNELSIDVYLFSSVGNAFIRKETQMLPLPFTSVVPCSPGPDNRMRVYSKITTGNPPKDYYVGESVAQLGALVVQS